MESVCGFVVESACMRISQVLSWSLRACIVVESACMRISQLHTCHCLVACCSVWQCVAVCQCAVVCGSVLQYIADTQAYLTLR